MTEPTHLSQRRPVAARQWKASAWIADALVRRGANPNGISISGAVFSIVGGVLFAETARLPDTARLLWLAAAAMIQLRLQCNLYDGMVAIATGRASPLGELYNDVPDRISDSALFIGAGYASGGNVALGYLAALTAMFTAYVRTIGKAQGTKQEFCGSMAKQHRMALLTAAALYGALTPKAWQPEWGAGNDFGVVAITLAIITLGSLVTAARRLLRIAKRLREQDA